MSALQFPSDQDFDTVAATAATIKWGDLPRGTVYAIKAIKVTKDKYGVSFVGDLSKYYAYMAPLKRKASK